MIAKKISLSLALILTVSVISFAFLSQRVYEKTNEKDRAAYIEFATVKADHSYYWLSINLIFSPPTDFPQPLELQLANGETLRSHDIKTTYTTEKPQSEADSPAIRSLYLRFWLENDQLTGPLSLHVGKDTLLVRRKIQVPEIANEKEKRYRSANW